MVMFSIVDAIYWDRTSSYHVFQIGIAVGMAHCVKHVATKFHTDCEKKFNKTDQNVGQ